MDLISLSEAKKLGYKLYYTGKSCKHGHITTRYVANARCSKCASIASYKSIKNRRLNNLEFRNSDNEYRKNWIATKKLDDNYRQKCNIQANKLRKENPIKHREKVARHKLAKIQRVPTWLSKQDSQSIKGIYAMRDWMNLTMFGIKYEVDHIIPIRGNKVSGLHVPLNLQIIKAQNNAIKGNQYEIL